MYHTDKTIFPFQFLNFVLILLQIYVTNKFLRGQFYFYGFKVFLYYSLPPEETQMMEYVNPMCEAFPRVASCTYWRYGFGGKPEGSSKTLGTFICHVFNCPQSCFRFERHVHFGLEHRD